MIQVMCVLVGEDADQWKVRLILSFISGEVGRETSPPYQTSYHCSTKIDNEDVEFEMFDTFGVEGYDRLSPLKYSQANVFLLFFSVSCSASFQRAKDKWFGELHRHCPSTPILLVGVTHGDDTNNGVAQLRTVGKEKGFRLAQKIKAARYIECSLHDISSIDAVFAETFRVLQQSEADNPSTSSSSCCVS